MQERSSIMDSMNKLSTAKRSQIVAALCEGVSIRATCRLTGAAKGTVLKLLVDLGGAAERYQDETLRGLKCRRIQCDEIWSFVYAKSKNVPEAHAGEFGFGDVWTWTALDAETKLVPSWAVGRRDAFTANAFIADLADRLAHRVQLTTDGHKVYLEAVEGAFGADVDYAMLVKMYEGDAGTKAPAEARYSPAKCTGAQKQRITGNPDAAHVSTSYVERQNLTMRMSMRRFTRLTNAFSKKADNLRAAVALYYMHYNFARIHQTLRVTPAMEAGISDHVWEIEEIVGLLDWAAARPEDSN
jgi:IS1 family transposase